MERGDLATPVKLQVNGDDIAIATPSGGLIFNPFHQEFMSRVGQATFSPGVFAYNSSPTTKDDLNKNTPGRHSAPFVLSPDTQGLLFPAEIDENPVFQLRLQEKLDTQCDDDVQDSIHSFFKSNLIAPSPDTLGQSSGGQRPLLPRTSSIIPTATPKIKRNLSCKVNPVPVILTEAAVQTALSVPSDFDLDTLIQHALKTHNTNEETLAQEETKENCPPVSKDDEKSQMLTDRPCFNACTVQRLPDSEINRHYYVCVTCRRSHSVSQHTRRSLFSDSSSIPDDSGNRMDDISSIHRTLIPHNSAPADPVHSTHLSSSVLFANESVSEDSAELSSSLLRVDTADDHDPFPSHLAYHSPYQTKRDDALTVRFHSTETLPTTPPPSNLHMDNCLNPIGASGKTLNQTIRRRFSLQSPCLFRDSGGIGSPNLSPILPASPITKSERLDVDCTMHTPPTRVLTSPLQSDSSVELSPAMQSRCTQPSLMDAD